MKRYLYGIVLFIALGCASRQSGVQLGGMQFVFEGEQYVIRSYTPPTLEGYNILTLIRNGEVIFRAIDKEQDGVLDEVIEGEIDLETAREIYARGIRDAHEKGKVRSRSLAREFILAVDFRTYRMTTYMLALGDIYNRLVITNIDNEQAVVVDYDANGKLDTVEEGDRDLKYYQGLYRIVLNYGMKNGDIIKTDNRFLVKK